MKNSWETHGSSFLLLPLMLHFCLPFCWTNFHKKTRGKEVTITMIMLTLLLCWNPSSLYQCHHQLTQSPLAVKQCYLVRRESLQSSISNFPLIVTDSFEDINIDGPKSSQRFSRYTRRSTGAGNYDHSSTPRVTCKPNTLHYSCLFLSRNVIRRPSDLCRSFERLSQSTKYTARIKLLGANII